MDTAPPSPASPRPPAPAHGRRKVAVAAAVASAVEWYDYFIFGIAAALVLGDAYFPSSSPAAETLSAFATFAVGFLARPLGGVIAGHLGDKRGRKPMLVLALTVMGLATTAIGLLPSYASIGLAAPVLLVVLRVLQGLAVGAQWGGAMLMATEYAPEGRRGVYGSLVQLGVPIGVVTANVAFLAVEGATGAGAFAAWGWRIPFAVGVLILGLAWFVHTRVEETPAFRAGRAARETGPAEPAAGTSDATPPPGATAPSGTAAPSNAPAPSGTTAARSPLRTVLRHHLGTVFLAGGSFAVNTATFYILITGVLDYTTRELGMDRGAVLTVSLLVSLTQFVLIPAAAALSDRVGRLPVYAAGALGLLVWAVPMFLLIDTRSLWLLAGGTFVASCFLSVMYGPQAALFAELFTAEMRYTGASLGYQISAVAGGGLAPFLMVLLLEATGTSMAVAGYIMVLSVLALGSIGVLARRARTRAATAAPPTAADEGGPA